MMLFDMERATVVYCLVDTPKETPGGEKLLHEWDNNTLHQFDGIVDPKKRISISETIYRDLKIEQKIRERYVVANRYYQDYLEELRSKSEELKVKN
jgi:hypothetical protein